MITLLDKSKQGDTPLIISQDPSNSQSIMINKSDFNSSSKDKTKGGIQFSYSFWILISSLEDRRMETHISQRKQN